MCGNWIDNNMSIKIKKKDNLQFRMLLQLLDKLNFSQRWHIFGIRILWKLWHSKCRFKYVHLQNLQQLVLIIYNHTPQTVTLQRLQPGLQTRVAKHVTLRSIRWFKTLTKKVHNWLRVREHQCIFCIINSANQRYFTKADIAQTNWNNIIQNVWGLCSWFGDDVMPP